MSQFLKYILTFIVAAVALSACNKAVSDEFVSYTNNPLNDTTWSTNAYNATVLNKIIFPEVIKNTNLVDTFDYANDVELNFGDSLQITIPANSCVKSNGSPISNNNNKVKAEITWLKKKGDFIKYATPTTNIFSLLEASNYCDIKLTKDGQEVALAPNAEVKIKFKDSTANSKMQFFTGNTIKYNKDSVFAWSPSNDGKIELWKDNSNGSGSKILGYEITTSRIRWFGAANYADSSIAKSKLNLILPPNFTNKNTAAFAVLKNSQTVINLLGNADNKTFFTFNIPVNAEFTLIAIARINGEYYFDSTVIKNISANPVSLSPTKKVLSYILDFINKI